MEGLKMKSLQAILALLLTVLVALIGLASSGQDPTFIFRMLRNRDPLTWSLAIETYAGVALVSIWMFRREASRVRACGWLLFFLCFGNIATITYIVIQLTERGEELFPPKLLAPEPQSSEVAVAVVDGVPADADA